MRIMRNYWMHALSSLRMKIDQKFEHLNYIDSSINYIYECIDRPPYRDIESHFNGYLSLPDVEIETIQRRKTR